MINKKAFFAGAYPKAAHGKRAVPALSKECPDCDGFGSIFDIHGNEEHCPNCGGSGYVPVEGKRDIQTSAE